MTYVIFHPSRGHMGNECYFTGEFLESSGRPQSSMRMALARKFETAAAAYEFAKGIERLRYWRVGKRRCAGRATN